MRAICGLSALMLVSACGGAATNENDGELAQFSAGNETSSVSSAELVDIENGELPDGWFDSRAAAPWSAPPVAANQAPGALISAWRLADNRDSCRPLAPTRYLEGARIRRADYAGGWAVEFDKQGMPGMTRNGRACTNCGRSAFGIAGTAISVEDEDPMEAEELTLADGSRVRYEPSVDEADLEDGDAAGSVASLKIAGQDCVYQVGSFSGEEHLQGLIEDLRFVDED
jgi:hypothetical protein